MSKGSRPRPLSISQQELSNRIEGIFGKKPLKEQYIPPPLPKDIDNSMIDMYNKTLETAAIKENK